jgi:hypothetical protein
VNWRRTVIALNNRLVLWRHAGRHACAGILVLLPRCIQRATCGQPVVTDIATCKSCGQCDVAALLALQRECGVRCHMAGGGREAARLAHLPEVRAIVACACEKELLDGIRAAFPKPVLAVANRTPHGFCRDTGADVKAIRTAIELLARAAPPPEGSPRPA